MSRTRLVVALTLGIAVIGAVLVLARPQGKTVPTLEREGMQYMDVEDRILDLMYQRASGTADPRDVIVCRERIRGELKNRFPEPVQRCWIVVCRTDDARILMEFPSMEFHREKMSRTR